MVSITPEPLALIVLWERSDRFLLGKLRHIPEQWLNSVTSVLLLDELGVFKIRYFFFWREMGEGGEATNFVF